MVQAIGAVVLLLLMSSPILGQTPQSGLRSPGLQNLAPGQALMAVQAPGSADSAAAGAPTAATLGFPLYPAMDFLASYDAGAFGQRYYLFGTTAPFNDIVTFYRAMLGTRGNLVFREPPTHMFEVGRFREDAMVFPPGITVKDWTWNSQGYPNPQLGAQPERFPTIIMVVPPPPQ